jgi:hypothetical protein
MSDAKGTGATGHKLTVEHGAMATCRKAGHFRLWVERDGETIQDTGPIENGYPIAGMVATAARMSGLDATAAFDYLEVGTDATAFADTQTALIAAIVDSGLARAQDGTPTATTTTETNDTMVINYSWSVTGTKTIAEIGCFNAASAGTMIGRSVVSPTVGVVNGDTLNGEYTVAFGV